MTPNVTLHRSKILNQPFQILNTGHGDANDLIMVTMVMMTTIRLLCNHTRSNKGSMFNKF